jgi:signal transduction histidine kinase
MREIIPTRAAPAFGADTLEREQSELRIVILCAAGVFVLLSSRWDLLAFALAGLALSLAQLAWIVLGSDADERRRSVAVLLDVALVTAAMLLATAASMMLCALYVWIVTDNAIRFGRRYLYYAQVLALTALAAVLLLRGFWVEHPALAAAMAVVLLIAPRYLSPLVTRLHAASHFAAGADHHLRQPLRALGVYASVLEERLRPPSADAARVLHELEFLLEALERQVDLLLLLAELESGKLKPAAVTFPLMPLLERAARAGRALAARRRLDLRVLATAESVRSDPALLEHMLAHLLACAIRSTKRGRVVVGCRRIGSDGLELCILSGARATDRSFELPLVQRLGRRVGHPVSATHTAFSIELERPT